MIMYHAFFSPAADIKYNFKVRHVNLVITLRACSSHTINTSESFWLHKFIACEFEVAMHGVVKRYESGLPSSPLAVCLSVGLDYHYVLQSRVNRKCVSK